jgi:hypothetical protein
VTSQERCEVEGEKDVAVDEEGRTAAEERSHLSGASPSPEDHALMRVGHSHPKAGPVPHCLANGPGTVVEVDDHVPHAMAVQLLEGVQDEWTIEERQGRLGLPEGEGSHAQPVPCRQDHRPHAKTMSPVPPLAV